MSNFCKTNLKFPFSSTHRRMYAFVFWIVKMTKVTMPIEQKWFYTVRWIDFATYMDLTITRSYFQE